MAYFRCTTGGSGKGNTLVVTCADDLAGATITCTNGTKTYTKTCPSTAPYEVTFYGLAAGTWTVSATVSGTTYTTTVVVADIEAELGGFNWKVWVDLSENYTSSDFTDLDDLLSDETAIRELMTIHACVNYLADIATTSEDVETIINNDLCAKWINNRDYALDTLYANTIIKGYMDTADKYFYGEWALVGQVPTMTSNTAPYGEASSNSTYSGDYPYYAFDGNESTIWCSVPFATNVYLRYKFVNPICARKLYYSCATGLGSGATKEIQVQGSNDGSTWTTLKTFNLESPGASVRFQDYVEFENDDYFIYYQIFVPTGMNTSNDGWWNIYSLQFYAWQPKGNVPVMTSNTAPYGVVSASSEYSSSGITYSAFKVFDGDYLTQWFPSSAATNNSIGYKFVNPIKSTKAKVSIFYGPASGYTTPARTFKIQGSNDGFTSDIHDLGTLSISASSSQVTETYDIDLTSDTYYMSLRLFCADSLHVAGQWSLQIRTLQFYGRELSVSVPKMATNTTPYGEAIYSSEFSTNGAWHAFDNDDTTLWGATLAATNNYVGYEFNNLTKLSMVDVLFRQGVSSSGYFVPERTFKVQGYTNGEWVDIGTITVPQSPTSTTTKRIILDTISDNACEKFRIFCADALSNSGGNYNLTVCSLQFYGLDYSEKEFEEGTNKKWLYDHGVELESFTYGGSDSSSAASSTNTGDAILISNPSTITLSGAYTTNKVDVTSYSLLRAKQGKNCSVKAGNTTFYGEYAIGYDATAPAYTWNAMDGYSGYTSTSVANPLSPYNLNLNISSVNQSVYLIISAGDATSTSGVNIQDFVELWLE